MAAGIGVLVMALTTVDALRETALAYLRASCIRRRVRPPSNVRLTIWPSAFGTCPVFRRSRHAVVHTAILDVSGFEEPVIGQLVSVPERGVPLLNRLAMRSGRYPRAGAVDEVVVSEPFADAHGFQAEVQEAAGDHERSMWRSSVVGIALSPEYVYAIAPGALMPDDRRFGVIWLGREALQGAFGLEEPSTR